MTGREPRGLVSQQESVLQVIRYGRSADQEADLHLPAAAHPPVVCLLHGGFWKLPYGRDQLTPIAHDLAARGLAAWNLEYRRTGGAEPAWPGTMSDVAAGIDFLRQLWRGGLDIDLERVAVVGHSAGGHLALWSAARHRREHGDAGPLRIRAAVALAPIADLAGAYERGVGGDAVAQLIGGPPASHPDRCRAASPIEMLPLGVRQLVLHGTEDDAVPIELSRRYAQAAVAAGDDVELIELAGTGHMEFLDPRGAAHATLCRRLHACLH